MSTAGELTPGVIGFRTYSMEPWGSALGGLQDSQAEGPQTAPAC